MTPGASPGEPDGQADPAADAVAAAAKMWGDTAVARSGGPAHRGWLDSPLVLRECVQPRLSGNVDENWLAGLVRRLGIPPSGHWLSLGCGGAGTEIGAARRGLFGSMLALDLAEPAIAEARRAAAARGVDRIEFGLVDFNRLELAPAAFDVVLMCMSLHHVAALEKVLRAVRAALKPGGYFLINEFVGPRQFQFPDRQLAVVRELLDALPERLRIDSTTGRVKAEYVRQSVAHWNRWDPSEAVRSDEIVPLLRRTFDVAVELPYGGTVLNLLLEHVVQNWDLREPRDVELFRLLARAEDLLLRTGVLANDFTVMAMRRPTWRSRLRAWRQRRAPHGRLPL
jgi:ubiquinone/menaquinone biosynthesis C-methylase UbiE